MKTVLKLHKKWLNDEEGGIRADLRGADLRGADLRGTYLSSANLRGADLSNAKLIYANLRGADLRGANLIGADLIDADLSNAKLIDADLRGANLSNTDLSNAKLIDADLIGADLSDADLSNADLSNANGVLSSIDFMNEHFEKVAEGYIAYKTFNMFYNINPNWEIKVGEVLKENVNFNRNNTCGCGINVAPLEWVKNQISNSLIYKVLIRNEWLMGVCVPYLSDGKIRCERVEILGIVEE